jgi:multidrug efflux system membrane fusion protein
MYAAFDVDEPTYLKFAQASKQAGGAPIPVQLGLANEQGYSRRGSVSFVDNQLDVASGTIRVRAIFDNADGTLIPGLYARVQVGGGKPHDALLIDERAVGTDQDKRFVLVLDAGNHAAYREVKLGGNSGGLRVVESGLTAGDRIVVNGLQRVRPGDAVAPNMVPMDAAAQGGDAA